MFDSETTYYCTVHYDSVKLLNMIIDTLYYIESVYNMI